MQINFRTLILSPSKLSSLACLGLLFTGPAFAQTADARFLVEAQEYDAPPLCASGLQIDPGIRGAAANDPRFSLNFRIDVAYQGSLACNDSHILSGADAAHEVINRYKVRMAQRAANPQHPAAPNADQMTIEIVRLGAVPPTVTGYEAGVPKLYYEPRDGLSPTYRNLTEHWWATTYKSHGIAQIAAWTQSFITAYKARQNQERALGVTIPDPAYLVGDFEGSLNFPDSPTVVLYQKFAMDGRYTSEIIPGTADASHPNGMTMAQLEMAYRNANGGRWYNYEDPADEATNAPWRKWYEELCQRVISATARAAMYNQFELAWPRIKISNYGYYSADGVHDSGKMPYTLPRVATVHDMMDHTSYHDKRLAFETLAAPLFYAPWVIVGTTEEEQRASQKRYVSHQVETIQNSFNGINKDSVAPWLALTGTTWQTQDFFNPTPWIYSRSNFTVTRAWNRDTMAVLRSKNVHLMHLFAPTNGPSQSTLTLASGWSDFHDTVQQVWAFNLTAATKGIAQTPASTAEVQKLWFSDATPVAVSGATTQLVAQFTRRSGVPLSTLPALHINAESFGTVAGDNINSVISIQRTSGIWLDLTNVNTISNAGPRWIQSVDVPGNTTDYVQADGSVRVRIQHRHANANLTTPINSTFDFIQVTGTDALPSFGLMRAPAPAPLPPVKTVIKSEPLVKSSGKDSGPITAK